MRSVMLDGSPFIDGFGGEVPGSRLRPPTRPLSSPTPPRNSSKSANKMAPWRTGSSSPKRSRLKNSWSWNIKKTALSLIRNRWSAIEQRYVTHFYRLWIKGQIKYLTKVVSLQGRMWRRELRQTQFTDQATIGQTKNTRKCQSADRPVFNILNTFRHEIMTLHKFSRPTLNIPKNNSCQLKNKLIVHCSFLLTSLNLI